LIALLQGSGQDGEKQNTPDDSPFPTQAQLFYSFLTKI